MFAHRRIGRVRAHDFPLAGHEMAVLAEPCLLCPGAIYWGGIRRVVWGASWQDVIGRTGFAEGPDTAGCREHMERQVGVEFRSGRLRDEAVAVLEAYRRRRERQHHGE